MKSLEWHSDALDDLVEHDAWRVSHGWDPVATEIMDAVSAVFGEKDLFRRKRCQIFGETVPVFRTWVEVRSKRFFIYYLETDYNRLVRRIYHPKRNRNNLEK